MEPDLTLFVDPVQGCPPECLVDCKTGRLRDEIWTFAERQLMRSDPDVGPLATLMLITALAIEFAHSIPVLAGVERDIGQSVQNQVRPFEIVAHLLGRLFGIVRFSATVDTRDNPDRSQVADNFLAELVPR